MFLFEGMRSPVKFIFFWGDEKFFYSFSLIPVEKSIFFFGAKAGQKESTPYPGSCDLSP